ncbi:2-hydroxyhepta-2,4-diene-1,7-dioate isomerase [Fusarium oxysporum Fo47]|uniref:2-hydroxyhepta-2,4-diene-1,7-dioate isomerase n=1 Tax=Fusarium oxysporum Fo47 TaxID=660027 RepID=UPI001597E9F5|nr:2-hydroxyhepta-2,4-diene-1,7-dioate isomerase [Fusarium oxysporum Fo47]QKD48523.1 2-hydroxyhepta-2,4-diene-1,7-dioate isomerase [Fusarium oxysporum Fo47]
MPTWTHLIRFLDDEGQTYLASLPSPQTTSEIISSTVTGYASFADLLEQNGRLVKVAKILSPLPFEGDIICIGTNYREHANEANLPVPLDPVMWYKPRRALAGPGEVPIPPIAANGFLDYEGELCIVLSRDARDVKVEEASDYVLGYTIGNDLTARFYQDPKRGGGQFTRCKAYDGFAPLGPVLTNAKTFGGVGDKKITTKVNDTVFQNSLCDLIHSPETLVSFLSQGTSLPAGTVIMTGSPPGIGYFQNPKLNLKDGDIVEVEISNIGTLTNKIVFQ